MTSHGSTAAASEAEGPPKPAELDALEAEIETIKADIQILRVGAESMHQTDILHTSDRQSDLPFRVEGSKIPTPISRQSAAKTGGGGSKRGEVKALCSKTQLTTSNINNSHLTSTPRSTQLSPHFAQPTQAATRRVHQTLRKDASPLKIVKASPEPSPGRSTKAKAPDFATDKRAAQRHQKRTSLPPTWTMSTPPMSESDALKHHPVDLDHNAESEHPTMPPPNMTGSGTSSTNAQPADQASNSTSPQKSASPAKSSSAEQSPKKASSYMSPTASAQRRSRTHANNAKRDARKARLDAKFDKKFQDLSQIVADSRSRLAVFNSNFEDEETDFERRNDDEFVRRTLSDGLTMNDIGKFHPGSTLPSYFPEVANTVLVRQEPYHNLLDSIKERLLSEGLLRSDQAQYQQAANAHRASQYDTLNPVLAHLNRQVHGGSNGEFMNQPFMVANAQPPADPNYPGSSPYSLYDGRRHAIESRPAQDYSNQGRSPYSLNDGQRYASESRPAQDYSNEPTSRIVTGLRGQHASESRAAQDQSDDPISRLVSGLRGQSSANIGRALGNQQPSDPVASDPAVLYQGPKPSSTKETEVPQSGSLRATAMTFVPHAELAQVNTSSPRGRSSFHEEHSESNQAQAVGNGYMPDYHEVEPSYLTYHQDFVSGETPSTSPVSDVSSGGWSVPPAPVSTPRLDYASVGATRMVTPSLNVERPPTLEPGFLEFHTTVEHFTTDTTAPWVSSAEIQRRIRMQEMYGPFPIATSQTSTFTAPPSAPTPAVSSPENLDTTPQWEIQGEGRRRYQWTGGDGREISFRGIGPDAEHDPNRPVEYRDLRSNTSTIHSPRQHGAASSASPPTAPRSMREQAKRMSDSQVPRAEDQQEGK
jgi:hypothetical protein